MEGKFKKAGIVIIGNEILKGHVRDSNSAFLCKRFHAIGVRVCRVVTVGDDREEIAEEVSRLSEKFDFVVTTGGIGPTHDDITYEAIASAFGDEIILQPEMVEVICSYFHGPRDLRNNPALKMAQIPKNSKLIYVMPKEEKKISEGERHNGLQEIQNRSSTEKKPFPVVQVKNVYVLPGMMEWLEHAFDHLQTIFENSELNIFTMILYLRWSEVKILKELNAAVVKYENRVIFGSYPSQVNNDELFKTKIILESTSIDEVTSAHRYLRSLLPDEAVNDELECKEAQLVQDLTHGNKSLSKVVSNSFKVIEAAIKKYKPNEIYVSFNGGKDCTVLLHLIWAVTTILGITDKLNCVYIKTDAVFPEVEDFVTKTVTRYKLNMVVVFGAIKSALTELHRTDPTIKAIFMGTRRTDPHSQTLQEFQMCDRDWPPLMRVSPILDWSYDDIWNFLRLLSVPYCSLYDEGYTSIGNPKNTRPNAALRISGSNDKYLPAFYLKDGSLERQGRK